MKKEIIPYTVDDLHSTIDYMKLIKLRAMTYSETLATSEKSKQKTYCNPVHNPNQRFNRDRESSGINPKNK